MALKMETQRGLLRVMAFVALHNRLSFNEKRSEYFI